MFKLRVAEHDERPGITVFEIWEDEILRGVIYPTEAGVRVVSKFLGMDIQNRIHTDPTVPRATTISLDLRCEPYFPGQKPQPCGHYYPDAFRMYDAYGPGGKRLRYFNCGVCGIYSIEVPEDDFDPDAPRKRRFVDEDWRQAERKRIRREKHE